MSNLELWRGRDDRGEMCASNMGGGRKQREGLCLEDFHWVHDVGHDEADNSEAVDVQRG